jgi:hypothetical protein
MSDKREISQVVVDIGQSPNKDEAQAGLYYCAGVTIEYDNGDKEGIDGSKDTAVYEGPFSNTDDIKRMILGKRPDIPEDTDFDFPDLDIDFNHLK